MGWLSDISGGLDALTNVAKLGYSIYQDQRTYRNDLAQQDYAKALQQTMFEREDTSLQRRMADAQAAGLNPYSVAGGSGAGAGSVVGVGGVSSNPLQGAGSLLDTMTALERYKQAVEETDYQKKFNSKALSGMDIDNALKEYFRKNTMYDFYRNEDDYMYSYGLKRDWDSWSNGTTYPTANFHEDGYQGSKPILFSDGSKLVQKPRNNVPFYSLLDYQFQNAKNSADMLQKQNNFYTADKIAEYVGDISKAVGNVIQFRSGSYNNTGNYRYSGRSENYNYNFYNRR